MFSNYLAISWAEFWPDSGWPFILDLTSCNPHRFVKWWLSSLGSKRRVKIFTHLHFWWAFYSLLNLSIKTCVNNPWSPTRQEGLKTLSIVIRQLLVLFLYVFLNALWKVYLCAIEAGVNTLSFVLAVQQNWLMLGWHMILEHEWIYSIF